MPSLDLTGVEVTSWGHIDTARAYVQVLERMRPIDRSVWIDVEAKLRNETRSADADAMYRAMKWRERTSWWRWPFKAASWLFFGHGTRVSPSVGLAVLLAAGLLAVLANPGNVKASGGLLAELGAQCARLREKRSALPPKCDAYDKAIGDSGRTGSVQLTASELQVDYDLGDAFQLTMRYAIPVIGIFRDSDWTPLQDRPTKLALGWLSASPSALAAFVLVFNTFLLSFAVAFLTRRWLR